MKSVLHIILVLLLNISLSIDSYGQFFSGVPLTQENINKESKDKEQGVNFQSMSYKKGRTGHDIGESGDVQGVDNRSAGSENERAKILKRIHDEIHSYRRLDKINELRKKINTILQKNR